MRIAVAELRKPHHTEEAFRAVCAFARRNTLRLQAEFDVLLRRPPGKQRVLLKDQAAIERRTRYRRPSDQDATRCWTGQAAQQVEQRLFPAAARTDDNKELSRLDLKADVLQRDKAAFCPLARPLDGETLTDVLNLNRAAHAGRSPWRNGACLSAGPELTAPALIIGIRMNDPG